MAPRADSQDAAQMLVEVEELHVASSRQGKGTMADPSFDGQLQMVAQPPGSMATFLEPKLSFSRQTSSLGGDVEEECSRMLLEHWELDLSELFVGRHVASGTYGRILHGEYRGREVAVKVMADDPQEYYEIGNTSARKQFLQEVAMLSQLDHPNLLKLVGAYQRPSQLVVVTEYIAGGNLRSFLQSQGTGLGMHFVLSMALDVARGMLHLHSKGIVHRDLKPTNVLLADDGSLKIGDFGIARLEGQPADMTAEMGTYRWMAPEVIKQQPYNHKVDVYSFGVLLWELVSGQTPFSEMSSVQVAFAVASKKLRPELPNTCPPKLSQLIQRCWHANPERRPDFSEVVPTLEKMQSALGGAVHSSASVEGAALRLTPKNILHKLTPRFMRSKSERRSSTSNPGAPSGLSW